MYTAISFNLEDSTQAATDDHQGVTREEGIKLHRGTVISGDLHVVGDITATGSAVLQETVAAASALEITRKDAGGEDPAVRLCTL